MKAIGSLMKSDKLLGVSSPHKVCEASWWIATIR
jgi:hypothetical protein